ncbi:unnamed protein product, partial [Polarella glacialis]
VPSRCDIWSSGVILFALVCGYLPFEDQNTAALYRKILNAEYQAPKFISDSVRDLIARMLNTDPEQRFNAPRIRAHAWYRQIPDAAHPYVSDTGDRPLDDEVLEQLDRFGFPRDYAIKCLQMTKHNHVTTTYHLLVEKKRRSGGTLKIDDAHARFEGTMAMGGCQMPAMLELPAERTPSPFQALQMEPLAGFGKPKLSLEALPPARAVAQDADRAAGGSSPHSAAGPKTPENKGANYGIGNWASAAFPGNFSGNDQQPYTARESSSRGSEMRGGAGSRQGAVSVEPPYQSGSRGPRSNSAQSHTPRGHPAGSGAAAAAAQPTPRRRTPNQ